MKKVIIEILKKYRFNILFISVFVMINIYLATYPSKIIGWIVDLLYNIEVNKEQIITYIVYLIVTAIILFVVRLPWRSLATYTSRSFEMSLKDRVFRRFLEIKLGNMQDIKNGEIMAYFTQDISEIRGFFYKCISYISRIIATIFIVIYTMIKGVNIQLTMITLAPIVITVFLIIKIKKYVEINSNRSKKYFTNLSEYVQESTDAIRTIKSYSCEKYRIKSFITKNKLLKGSNIAVEIHSTLLSICMQVCFGVCYGISIIYGSKLILDGSISIGDFIAFNGYIGLFVGPVDWLPGIISKYKSAKVSYQRLDQFFQLEREEVFLEQIDKEKEDLVYGDIEINHLTFNYPANIEVALTNINLQIKQGETIGIMGTIGSGKTTLANLLLRLYPVQNGKIKIGGRDINEIPLPQLRKSICYITQDNFLFSTTLKDNISLFKEGYNDEDIRKSTVQSRIDSEIEQMKNGIYTMIGERGVDLSGGQKQRVVISRAFLLRSNIIIFDDTFSALDNKTEEQVLKNVRELCQDKTCIIISNRISDVKDADKIVVLDNGEIIETGTHEGLLQENGLYRKFYYQQSSSEELEVC